MQTILISRTDAIGDVVLTLSLAGWLREQVPGCRIVFLCTAYTKPVVAACEHVDEVVDWNQIASKPEAEQVERLRAIGADCIIHVFPRREIARAAWKAGIAKRIGTTHRLYHLRYCNKWVGLGRKKSPYHEAILNILLARPVFPGALPELEQLWRYMGFTRIPELPDRLRQYIASDKLNIVLHPRSRGSAYEWNPASWEQLAGWLPADKFNIILTGTAAEGESIRETIAYPNSVHNLAGTMTLDELIAFLQACDGLVAASTGPLHIAAALGKRVIGLYPDTPPMHPGRWGPIGKMAEVMAGRIDDRRFVGIDVESVFKKVMSWLV